MDSLGRYQLLDKLGQGGMGVVYRAYDTLLQRTVAVKLISGPVEESADLRERFFREARAAGQLTHKNIITIYDLGEHEGRPYLAMELLEGEDLQRRLAQGEAMPLFRKIDVTIDLCEALEFAHRHGVVHRDVKPANIFITTSGSVKILDFGLARLVTSEMTNSNMMMGTLNYMAPEQVRGERADHRSDIFSAGVVLYEMLSGKKAFQGDSFASTLFQILEAAPQPLHEIDASLPVEVIAIVDRTLAKSREQRYQQMPELLADLLAVRQQIGSQESPARGYSVPTAPVHVPATVAPTTPPIVRPPTPRTPVPAPRTAISTPAPEMSASEAPTGAPVPTPIGSPAADHGRPRSRLVPTLAGVAAVAIVAAAIVWNSRSVEPPAQTAQPAPAPAPAPAPSTSSAPAASPPAATNPAEPRVEVDPAFVERAAQDARARMADAKAAVRSMSARANAAALQAAAAAEREAERLLKAGRLAEAAAKFYEAGGLYRSAAAGAAAAAPPPASNPATKPAAPAPPAAPPPAPDLPIERPSSPPPIIVPAPPPAPPAASPQPAPVTTPALPPASPVTPPEELIRDVLSRYEAALEARSIDAIKRLWPSLTDSQQAAMQKEFQHASRIDVTLLQPQISVSGNTATATFTRRYQMQSTEGVRLQSDSRTTMTLRHTSAGWFIDQIRFDSPR